MFANAICLYLANGWYGSPQENLMFQRSKTWKTNVIVLSRSISYAQ